MSLTWVYLAAIHLYVLHASSAYHVLFNMLMLWMFGCELSVLGWAFVLRYFLAPALERLLFM